MKVKQTEYSFRAPKKRVAKNGKARWMARYTETTPSGFRRDVTIGTFEKKSEAEDQTRKTILGLERIRDNELVETGMTVEMFIEDEWFDFRSNQMETNNHLPAFIQLCRMTGLADQNLVKINQLSIRRFWMTVDQYIEENDLSGSYRDKVRANLNSMLDYAVEQRYLENNPNFNLKISARTKRRERESENKKSFDRAQRIWTIDQISKFLPLFKNNGRKIKSVDSIMWWGFFTIGIFTGMRKGEIAGLKFSDLKDNKLTIQRNAVVNDRTGKVDLNNPKYNSFGSITVPKEVIEVFEALKLYHEINESLDHEYLFQYKTGGMIYPDYWGKMWKKVQIQVGIPEDQILPSSHYLRHTHLSLLVHQRYSLAEVQRRARHTDPRTTSKYYVHILDERESEMSDAFAEAVRSRMESQVEKS